MSFLYHKDKEAFFNFIPKALLKHFAMETTTVLRFGFMRYAAWMLLLISLGCKKATTENTAPHVYSGDNQLLFLPANSCLLKGESFDMQNNIDRYSWTKIAGPDRYTFDNAVDLNTRVLNLEVGEYLFELTAVDKFGLSGSDTVAVNVLPPPNGEYIFKNLQWMCPMGCSLAIESFHTFIPRGEFMVSIKKPNGEWSVVGEDMYDIYDDGTLVIFSAGEEEGSVDVKVTF